jgi:hypothetical protein
MNVVATMASTKCQGCGTVFPVNGTGGASRPGEAVGDRAPTRSHEEPADTGENNLGHWLVVGGVATLAVLGLAAITFFTFLRGSGEQSEMATPQPPMRTDAAVVEDLQENIDSGATEFRVVDLPESTRRQIYRDHKKMIASSFGKARKIPKSGVAGQTLNKGLGGIVDSEVTKMALIHRISEDDYAQIIAEGEAKDW